MKIGILAMQGDFAEHIIFISQLGVQPIEIRQPAQLSDLDGLIIPGGESTTILKLMYSYNLFHPIKELAKNGLPVMGTCAGMVLLAKKVSNPDMNTLSLMDVVVRRNAFGRQLESFESVISIPEIGDDSFPAVFIRAPLIENASSGVTILSRLPDSKIVAARQGNLLALSFHPELSNDSRIHRYFLEIAATYKSEVTREVSLKEATPADL